MNSGIPLQSPLAKTKKITTNINNNVTEIVKNFYTRDDITRQAPGKQDTAVMGKKKNFKNATFP